MIHIPGTSSVKDRLRDRIKYLMISNKSISRVNLKEIREKNTGSNRWDWDDKSEDEIIERVLKLVEYIGSPGMSVEDRRKWIEKMIKYFIKESHAGGKMKKMLEAIKKGVEKGIKNGNMGREKLAIIGFFISLSGAIMTTRDNFYISCSDMKLVKIPYKVFKEIYDL